MDLCFLFVISVLNHGYNPSISVVIIASGLFAQRVCRSDAHWCIGPQVSVDQTGSKQYLRMREIFTYFQLAVL